MPSLAPSGVCDEGFFDGSWLEEGSDMRVDVDLDGRYSAGDFVIYDSNTITRVNQNSGHVAGWCRILVDTNKQYCVSTFDFPDGFLLSQGVYEATSVAGGTSCHENLAGTMVGSKTVTAGGDEALAYSFREIGILPNGSCDDITGDFWTGTGFGLQQRIDGDGDGSISPGDTYLLDVDIRKGNGTVPGTLVGECTILQDSSFDNRFCFLTAYFEDGSLSLQGPFRSMLITGGTGCFANREGIIAGTPEVTSKRGEEMSYKFLTNIAPTDDSCKVNRFRNVWIETGSDIFLDRDNDELDSPGDAYIFNHVVTTTGLGRNGTASGSCMYLETLTLDTFCSINFEFAEGSLAVQGFFNELVIGKQLYIED